MAENESVEEQQDEIQQEEEPQHQLYTYPYDWITPAATVCYANNESVLVRNNFHKTAKWSPDGNCILTSSEDNILRVYNVPPTSLGITDSAYFLQPVVSLKQGEGTYDTAWYPGMRFEDPSTCCFLASSRDHPIELIDSVSGVVRCCYPSHNHVDEIVAPNALAFNLDGSLFYGGFQNSLRIYDINRPGDSIATKATTPTKRSKEGQKGLISSITFCPDGSGVYAVGTFAGHVGLYAENNDELIFLFSAHPNGVTQLSFSPDGRYLISGGRRDDELLCWDVHNTGKVFCRIPRPCSNNQKLSFGFDASGKYLVAGQQDGTVTIHDVSGISENMSNPASIVTTFSAHTSCVVSASLHPSWPLLMTAAGERRYDLPDDDEPDEPVNQLDNSLKVWRIGLPWTQQ